MTSTPRQRFKSANPPHLFPSQFELNYGCREFLSADACFVDVGPTKFGCQTGHVGGHRTHCRFLRVGGFRQVEGCSRCRVQPMQISVCKSWGLSSFSGRCCLDRSCLSAGGMDMLMLFFPVSRSADHGCLIAKCTGFMINSCNVSFCANMAQAALPTERWWNRRQQSWAQWRTKLNSFQFAAEQKWSFSFSSCENHVYTAVITFLLRSHLWMYYKTLSFALRVGWGAAEGFGVSCGCPGGLAVLYFQTSPQASN